MASNQEQYLKLEQEDQLNELVILGVLLRNWWKIAIVTLAVGVGMALYSLTLPNVFRSTSALIINTPETPMSGEVEPLNPEALRILSTSLQIKRTLFTSATQQGILNPKQGFVDFQQTLSATGRSQQSRPNDEALPLVELSVNHGDPEVASQVANIWADLVLSETRRIYRAGVEDFHVFANRALNEIEEELAMTEENLTSMSLKSNLGLKKREIENAVETYARVFDELQNISEQVDTQTAQLKYLRRTINEQSIDGVWYGNYMMQDEIKRKIIDGENLAADIGSDMTRRIIRTAARVISNQAQLEKFEEEINLETLETEYQQAHEDIAAIFGGLQQTTIELAELREQNRQLDLLLEKTPQYFVLRKAITDDAYWQAHLAGREGLKDGELPFLATEEVNPEYASRLEQKTTVSIQLKAKQASLEAMQSAAKELRSKVGTLKRRFLEARNRKSALVAELESDQYFLVFAEGQYGQALQDIQRLESDLGQNQELLKTNRDFLNEIRQAQSQRQSLVRQIEDRIAALQRERDSLLETRQSLAQRAREVNLLKISASDVSRSGVALFYRAEPNPQKVGPGRRKMVLGAMVVTAVLISLFMTLRFILQCVNISRENTESVAQ